MVIINTLAMVINGISGYCVSFILFKTFLSNAAKTFSSAATHFFLFFGKVWVAFASRLSLFLTKKMLDFFFGAETFS
jgi:hypothetical protein